MKIRVLSDLHIDFGGHPRPADCGEDLVVLAGDICEGLEGIDWALEAFPRQGILFVLGNHEFYNADVVEFVPEFRAHAAERGKGRLRLLEREAAVIEGVRFIGATLWTDYTLYGASAEAVAESMAVATPVMLDYRRILNGPRYLAAPDTVPMHHDARRFITLALASGDPAKTVVVTHHAPHRGSLAPRFAEDRTSAAFVTDLANLMGRAKLWIHGHTHTSFDYTDRGTRVVCNPRGYCTPDGERCENPDFRWDLLFDV